MPSKGMIKNKIKISTTTRDTLDSNEDKSITNTNT
jgi:hypothetical protein